VRLPHRQVSPRHDGQPAEFTGERFVPGIGGEIAQEHWHRYAFARNSSPGAGSRTSPAARAMAAPLAASGASVIGVDMIQRLRMRGSYGALTNLQFVEGSATALRSPMPASTLSCRSRRSSTSKPGTNRP
jgi:hypothetical protein